MPELKPKTSEEVAEIIDNTYDDYHTDWIYHEEHGLISPWCEDGTCPCSSTSGDVAGDIWGNEAIIFYCDYCYREEFLPCGNQYDRESYDDRMKEMKNNILHRLLNRIFGFRKYEDVIDWCKLEFDEFNRVI